MNTVDWIIIFVGGTIQIAIILSYLSQDADSKFSKFLSRITPSRCGFHFHFTNKKVTNEATNEQCDPMFLAEMIGKYRVALQYDKATGTDRWIVDQLLIAKSGARAEVRRADYPSREQALEYARGYANRSKSDHPLPNRRAAIAHTKAKL